MAKPKKAFTYRDNKEINQDVQNLFDFVSRLEVVTDNPDGSRVAKFDGEVVLLKSGGNYYVEVAIGSGTTTWRGCQLTNTP